jgi:hypothetical protein
MSNAKSEPAASGKVTGTVHENERRTEMNRLKTRACARFRVIRANGKVEQHILIFDPAEVALTEANVLLNCIEATASRITSIYAI